MNLFTFVFIYFLLFFTSVVIKNDINKSYLWSFCLNLIKSEYNWIIFLVMLHFLKKINNIYLIFYLNIDYISFFWLERNNQIINTLTNGFFLIHPVFIFFTYLIGVFLLFNNRKKLILLYVIFSITAIFLGSWWANQELGWGGWWSWDFVEIINLLLVLIGLIWLHNRFKNIKLKLNTIPVLYFFIFLHLSIRYDFFNSIHSFTSSFNVEYKKMFFLCLVLMLLIVIEKIEYKLLDFNIFLIKSIFLIFIIKISLMYQIGFFKNEFIWYLYIFFLVNYLCWIFLNFFKKNTNNMLMLNSIYYIIKQLLNTFKNMNSFFIHFIVLLTIFVYFIKRQFDYFFEFDFKNNFIYFSISDFLILKKRYIEIWYSNGILEKCNISDIAFIPLYNYNIILDNFLTSNNVNLSFYSYYFDFLIISILLIIIKIFKNIIYSYTKYKIWCI